LNQLFSEPFPSNVHLVVLRGSGDKAFAAGADITEFMSFTPAEAQELSQSGQSVFQKIENCKTPVLALIDGYALGGGLELAMACHLRAATSKSILGLPELNLGLIPGYGGTQRLAKLIGKGKAIYHTLISENLSGKQAFEAGLADFYFEEISEAEEWTQKLVQKLAKKSKVSVGLALDAIQQNGQPDGFKKESFNFMKAFESEDMKEGVAAFLEKRKATFIHR
jgi:enoyl-CoA hydratase